MENKKELTLEQGSLIKGMEIKTFEFEKNIGINVEKQITIKPKSC